MARTITVDPAKLDTASGTMAAQAGDYKKIYEQLFSEVDGMAAAWQGKDNVAFTTRIKGFTEDLQNMYNLMMQYSEFLKSSASKYRETQDDIVAQANKLTN